ncbi:MAG TPA: hypothetical protein VG992_02850 [Candidatus Saccharimonadales bacterium]|nr:hypothetical protein [Candidatus Saccharimonadales bacterium]
MSVEQISLDQPDEYLQTDFIWCCLRLHELGVQRFPLAHGQTAEIIVDDDRNISYDVATPLTDPNGQQIIQWTYLTRFDDGRFSKTFEIEKASDAIEGEAIVPISHENMTMELLSRIMSALGREGACRRLLDAMAAQAADDELGLSHVSATELQTAVDAMEAVIASRTHV